MPLLSAKTKNAKYCCLKTYHMLHMVLKTQQIICPYLFLQFWRVAVNSSPFKTLIFLVILINVCVMITEIVKYDDQEGWKNNFQKSFIISEFFQQIFSLIKAPIGSDPATPNPDEQYLPLRFSCRDFAQNVRAGRHLRPRYLEHIRQGIKYYINNLLKIST